MRDDYLRTEHTVLMWMIQLNHNTRHVRGVLLELGFYEFKQPRELRRG